jgi:hypothetical protein
VSIRGNSELLLLWFLGIHVAVNCYCVSIKCGSKLILFFIFRRNNKLLLLFIVIIRVNNKLLLRLSGVKIIRGYFIFLIIRGNSKLLLLWFSGEEVNCCCCAGPFQGYHHRGSREVHTLHLHGVDEPQG